MNVLIVEDEMLISEMLKDMLLELGHEVTGQATNYLEAIHFLEHFPQINFVFCDINLNSDYTGIDLGQMIQTKYGYSFVYLTSYSDDKTLNDASVTHPAAYIIKPFNIAEIKATLVMIQARGSEYKKRIVLKDGHSLIKICIQDIDYVESDDNYITIHVQKKKYVVRNSLDNFIQESASENIVRVHRSFAVNLTNVSSICGQFLETKDRKIPLSKKYRSEIISLYNNLSR